jgi:hypothetical protein
VVHKLLGDNDPELAQIVTKKMLAACTSTQFSFEFDVAFKVAFGYLLAHYRDTVWPLLSNALLSDERDIVAHLTDLFGDRSENEESSTIMCTLPDDFLLEWCEHYPSKAPAVLARIMPLFQHEGEKWTWTRLAGVIIDRYGAQQAVRSALTSNFGIYSWSGSLVPYYARRAVLLEELRTHHLPEVRRWAGEQLRYVQQQIGWESTRDAERELGIF